MKSKKKKYYAGGSASPAEALGEMQRAKMGVAKGSLLEGGQIKYASSGPGDGAVDDIIQKRSGYVADEMKLYDQANKRKAMQMLRRRKKITKKGDLFGTSFAPGNPAKQHGVDKELFKYLKREIKSKYK
jgi:hypothetical protein